MAFLNKAGVERLWAHIISKLGEKVDIVEGKGLSTNDYTTVEKNKLAGISESADAVSFSRSLTSGTKVGTITINGTGTDLYAPTNTTYSDATTSAAGLMSAADKAKLDGIESGANNTIVDSTLSVEGQAADAKATGDAINTIQSSIDNISASTLKNLVDDDKGNTGTSGKSGAIRHITTLGQTPDDLILASGENSLSWGAGSTAGGATSIAFGNSCQATINGNYAQAFGNNTYANGEAATAIGLGTKAESAYQLTLGKYNISDTNNTYAMIVGNGTGSSTSARSNAHTIDWNGNAWYAGGITVGENNYNIPTASSSLHMVVSDTEPTSPTTGMLWFDIS